MTTAIATPTNMLRTAVSAVASAGLGTFTIGAASSGFRTFDATHDQLIFTCQISEGTTWEIRSGCVYTSTGTTLTRGTLEDSSTGSAITFTTACIVRVILSQGMLQSLMGVASPYVGQVATRCGAYSDAITTAAKCNSETEHTVFETLTSLAVIFGNQYSDGTGVELGSGGATTDTASLNYPYGTLTQFLFAGSASVSIPNGGIVVSDFLKVPKGIPANSRIKIRRYNVSTVNMAYSTSMGGPNDLFEYGPSVTDKTLSGTIVATAPGSGLSLVPIGIIGITTRASVFILLDSIAFQFPDTNNSPNAFGDISLARSFGPQMAYINGGIGGASCTGFMASSAARTNRMAMSQWCSHIFNNGGANDIAASRTSAQLIADRTAMAALFPGKPVFGGTITPRTTGSWGTLTGQTVLATESVRIAFNTAQRAGIPGEKGFFDIADGIESDRNSGKFQVGTLWGATTGTANTTDGLHPLPSGHEIIRSRNVIRPSYLRR